MCVVADLTDLDSKAEICSKSHLELAPPDSCISTLSIPNLGEFLLVITGFLLGEAILAMLVVHSHSRNGGQIPRWANKTALGLLYWYNDFWAGLIAWQCAAYYVTTGLKDGWTKMACNFLAGMCIEVVIYDGPMKMIRGNPDGFIVCSSFLGLMYGLSAIIVAYSADCVVLMGHHVIRMGLWQFAVDIGKAFLWHLGQRVVYGNSVKPYEPLVDELTGPLP
mmetsp:Transcript_30214/g.89724  ORF Transcript_30214/g.89724 Transcript_30214/m.89724 type:complete len:221 (+) Transcript_30214:244-906(+)